MASPSAASRIGPVAVIGGGITGLVAAYRLWVTGADVHLFEASHRVGGAIRSERDGDWLAEAGPNTLLDSAKAARDLLLEIGLGPRTLAASAFAKHRFVVRNGRPVAMPTGPLGFATTGLFTLRDKLRLLREPFIPPSPPASSETLAEFALRRLGRGFLDYAVDPFVSGVYAGDPARLSVRAAFPKLHALEQKHGSLLRGALARRSSSTGPAGRIVSFPEGLEELPRTLAAKLGERIHLGAPILGARRELDGWHLESPSSAVGDTTWSRVVLALPPTAAAAFRITGTGYADDILPLQRLAQLNHPPVTSVFLGFPRAAVRHKLNGFGLLAPSIERRRILGVLFSSSLFPQRAPEGHVALTVMVGGVRQPEQALLEDEALLAMVCTELNSLLGISGRPVHRVIHRWPRAIPQYTEGVLQARAFARSLETWLPGLHIGGQSLDGVALGACIESGERLAVAALTPLSL